MSCTLNGMGAERCTEHEAERVVARSIDVVARPHEVFDLLANPHRHSTFDGSGSVRGRVSGPDRLVLGSRFGMRMRIGLTYTIRNTVVEYEPERKIAWRHFNGHRWRYRLEPLDEDRTRVIEAFDWSTARAPRLLEWIGAPRKNARAIERTLERLKGVVEG